jgi:hypothetical protein
MQLTTEAARLLPLRAKKWVFALPWKKAEQINPSGHQKIWKFTFHL